MKTTSKTPKMPAGSLPLKQLFTALLLLLAGGLWSCEILERDKTPEPTPAPGPVSKIPSGVAGKWLYGNFSMGDFWKYDGTYVGNAFELGLAFVFGPGGACEFYLATGGTSFNCRTEAFVYKKGTVQFDDNGSFTFHPTEGSARGFYKGCASSYKNYDKKYTPQDLKPETYYYALEKDSNGKEQLLIRFKPTDASPTTFRPATW
jgi:hypothetical protein